jgi:branched-chain amino acid transport system substrate-binding protein
LCVAIALWAIEDAAGEVRIGLSAPLTGPLAIYGAQVKSGVDQAIDDLNERGGVLDNRVQLISYDDQCDPQRGPSIAARLADEDRVALVIGPACTAVALAALPVLGSKETSLVDILPSAVASALTERGYSNVFRVVPRADRQGPVAGAYLQRTRDYNIAVLNDGSSYAREIGGALRQALPNLQDETRLQAEYDPGQPDFRAIIERLRAANIKVAYVAGLPTGFGNLVRQARAASIQALFVGSDAAASPQLWSIAGDSAEGTLLTFFPDPARNPQSAPIVERMQRAGRQSSIYGLYAYAAVQAWAQATTSARSFDAKSVSAALHGGSLETVIGPVAFDQKGDIRELDYVFYRWQSGRVAQMNDRPPPPPPPPPQ